MLANFIYEPGFSEASNVKNLVIPVKNYFESLMELFFVPKVHVAISKSKICAALMSVHVVLLAIIVRILAVNQLMVAEFLTFIPFCIIIAVVLFQSKVEGFSYGLFKVHLARLKWPQEFMQHFFVMQLVLGRKVLTFLIFS